MGCFVLSGALVSEALKAEIQRLTEVRDLQMNN